MQNSQNSFFRICNSEVVNISIFNAQNFGFNEKQHYLCPE